MKHSTNTGHGHVRPRPDGRLARCGGPGLCSECSKEFAMLSPQSLRDYLDRLEELRRDAEASRS